jgi:hypothetical protein
VKQRRAPVRGEYGRIVGGWSTLAERLHDKINGLIEPAREIPHFASIAGPNTGNCILPAGSHTPASLAGNHMKWLAVIAVACSGGDATPVT